jgi:hypothetical protein
MYDAAHPSPAQETTMADAASLTDAERAKLEQRRDRLMKLMKEGDGSGGGSTLDADDRADLAREWNRIDSLLNQR